MKDTNYAYAIANVRSAEPQLISKSFMEQLADTSDFEQAKRLMADSGIDSFDDYMVKSWQFLENIAPDIKELEFLIVKIDFHNLNAIIKGIISGTEGIEFCIRPCILEVEELQQKIKNGNFEELPHWISKTAEEAYSLLTSTMDGQLFDMFIDIAGLKAIKDFALLANCSFAEEFTELFVAIADIKIAVRIAGTQRGEAFLNNAFCVCDTLDTDELKKAVLKGKEELVEYIGKTKYSDLCGSILKSTADLERVCDNMIMAFLDDARYVSFGPQPLICYYLARETELKMLRIIASCKNAELGSEVIRERMRELYV